MDVLKKYYPLAEKLNCMPYIYEMEQKATQILDQEKTVVVVTGMRRSGKTTAINMMVGSEVWESGAGDDDEKPLRVSFEPMEENNNYQCISAMNHEWRERDAVILELREEYLIKDGVLADELMSADKIFFLISAMAPFNIDEVKLLKKMKGLNCQILVNGIEHIRESEREKVKGYISKINNSLGLTEEIYVDNTDGNFGKKVRDALPSYDEQKVLRDERVKLLANDVINCLEIKLNKMIEQNKEREKQRHSEQETLDSEVRRMQSSIYTLCTDVKEYKENAIQKAIAMLNGTSASMAEKVIQKSDINSATDIQAQMIHIMEKKNAEIQEVLKKGYLENLKNINSAAILLGLPGWDNEVYHELEKNFPEIKKSVNNNKTAAPYTEFGQPIESNPLLQKVSEKMSEESSKILIGTGVATVGFLVAPIPEIVSIVGGATAAGVGGNMYFKKRQEEKKHELKVCLKKAFAENNNFIKAQIRETVDCSYKKIIEELKKCEDLIMKRNKKEPSDKNLDVDIEKAILLLQDLKQNK